ncbi:glycoside hydrolase family 3 N-terminal domain-containing protein [Treponema brennaborense]|uniref:beta-N-acetylhexosaminidase n=1 Tax=Treponema brennaborense (strain DSM 12168 / CIP 105900 / DD5/3) TaxID=906968 RepID=F4LJ21_TREBD|nr:glycoside hydrolase family 3 N-terminal domain-containing protein [Treponema brennaborense]AEE17330.1 glycoside hydrolase family 3 domain protein [Treponema brennaborense DSM 12168]
MSRGLLKHCCSPLCLTSAAVLLWCALGVSCGQAEKKQNEKELKLRAEARASYESLRSDMQLRTDAVREFARSLSAEEKIAQLFLVNLEGKSVFRPIEYTADGTPLVPGGYLFFSYNIADSAPEIMRFTESIAAFCRERNLPPPLLTIDQEGGVVNRLRAVTSPLPSAQLVASRMPPSAAEALYAAQARQLSALGFHINLAPVAEAAADTNRQFLGTRSFGDAAAVGTFAAAAVRGYESNGIGAVLKHFPGNTNDDPHSGLPEITLSAEALETHAIAVFRSLLRYEPAGVLMSHARTAAYDGGTPACLSPFWVTSMLRETLGYTGLIFSDDIFMAALERNGFPPDTAAVMAIEAGVDVIMLSEKKFASAVTVLLQKAAADGEFAAKIDAAVVRILQAKIAAGVLELERTGGYRSAEAAGSAAAPGSAFDSAAYAVRIAPVHEESRIAVRTAAFSTAFDDGSELYSAYFGGKK